MLEFKNFINPHRASNTYIVYKNQTAVIIDVGNMKTEKLVDFLLNNNLKLKAVFLTHEHADHCCGIDILAKYLQFDLYCSLECYINAQNPKLNYSKYLEEIENFSMIKKPKKLLQNSSLQIDCLNINSLQVAGHSPGCMAYQIDDLIFTGDTLMESKTPLNLPNSSKNDYQVSLEKLKKIITAKSIICPGHGEVFTLN